MRYLTPTQMNNKTSESEMRQADPPLRINTSHGTETVHSRCSTNEGHLFPLSQSEGRPVPPVPGFRPLVWNNSQPQYTTHLSHGGRPDIIRPPDASQQRTYPEAWHAHQHQIRQHNAYVESGSRALGPHVRMPFDARTQQGLVPDAQRLRHSVTRLPPLPLTVVNPNNHRLEEGERQVAKLHEEMKKLKATVLNIKAQFTSLEQTVEMSVKDIGQLTKIPQDCPREFDFREQPTPSQGKCNRCQRQCLEDMTEINAPSLESIECDRLGEKGTVPRDASVVVMTDRESIEHNLQLPPRPRSQDGPVPASIRYNLRKRK